MILQHLGGLLVPAHLQVLVDQQQQERVLVRAHLDRLTGQDPDHRWKIVINTSAHAPDPARATTPPSNCIMGDGVFFWNVTGSPEIKLGGGGSRSGGFFC